MSDLTPRHVFRLLRSPSALLSAATLALGIGTTTAVFTLVYTILIRSLPYDEPDRIVMVWAENEPQGWHREKISFPELRDWAASGLFEGVVGFIPYLGTITAPGEPEVVHGYAITSGALQMLGVTPLLGRAFDAAEEAPNGRPAVLLRHSLWMRRFGGDPSVVGKAIEFNGASMTVVGVMPASFQFFSRQSELLFPAPFRVDQFGRARFMRAMGRLQAGLDVQQAQERANVLAAAFAEKYPESNAGWRVELVPLPVETVGPVRWALLVIMGAASLVMLIACSNVASLLFARSATRARQMARARMALGARRWHIVTGMLSESLVLALVGAVPGMLLAFVLVRYFQHMMPSHLGVGKFLIQLDQIRIDPWVLAFAALLAPVAACVVGIIPALSACRVGLAETLNSSTRGGTAWRRAHRSQRRIVVAEIAVSVVLAGAAGLFIRSFTELSRQGPGFRTEHLQTLQVQLPAPTVQGQTPQQRQAWVKTTYGRILDRAASLPAIDAVATVNDLPLSGFYWLSEFTVENRVQRDRFDTARAIDRWVSPSYFATLGLPLQQGRYLSDSDSDAHEFVAVVNEQFAKRYLDGQPVIGRRIKAARAGASGEWHTVAGVIRGERMGGMEEEPLPMVFFSTTQHPQSYFNLVVRSRLPLAATMTAVDAELKRINPSLAVYAPRTLDDLVIESTWRIRYATFLLNSLGLVSLALVFGGVFAVCSFGFSQRAKEIGIRMALGSSPSEVRRMLVKESLQLAFAGVAIGSIGVAALGKALTSILFQVPAVDWPTLIAVAASVIVVGLGACYLPARRITRLDPLAALRNE